MTVATVPVNLEAERQVLGALLTSDVAPGRIETVGLEPAAFYRDRHRIIYTVCLDLHRSGRAVDLLTATNELPDQRDYLHEIAATVAAPGNVKHHAEIVRDLYRQRQAITLGQEIVKAAQSGPMNGNAERFIEQLTTLTEQTGTGPSPFRIRQADLSRVQPTRWLWQHRLPVGYVSLLVGAEGVGKGTLSAWLIAQITQGTLPGDSHGTPARVLIAGDEDGFDTVWTPRLYAAGANLDLVDVLDEDDDHLLDVGRDAGSLGHLIRKRGYRLLFIDALLDVLGRNVDDYKSKSVREATRPLRRMAREHDLVTLGSLHPNKGRKASFRELVSGSHAFNAISRSSLYLAEHPEDQERRILVRPKGNLSIEPPGFEFKIEGRDLEINGHGHSLPVVARQGDGELKWSDVLTPATVVETLTDQIDAVGTGEVQSRTEIARMLDRPPQDRSVGRALEELAELGRWEKVGRGKWRKVASGSSIGTPLATFDDAEVIPFPESAS